MPPELRVQSLQGRIESVLAAALPPEDRSPGRLHAAQRYAVLGGGKRLRPLLVYATGECLSIPIAPLDAPAAAVELIHAYSLVHDDLPAMDDDDLRRGRPTTHRAFDEATAILAGDALQVLAFELLAADTPHAADPRARLKMIRILAEASGTAGMAGGQALDLAAVGRSLTLAEVEVMHRMKTGALIRASVLLAAACVPDLPEPVFEALDACARDIGLAFQIQDDILDIEGESARLGKRTGADAARSKPTYPSVLGLSRARSKALELRDRTLQRLGSVPGDTSLLAWIAAYVVDRQV